MLLWSDGELTLSICMIVLVLQLCLRMARHAFSVPFQMIGSNGDLGRIGEYRRPMLVPLALRMAKANGRPFPIFRCISWDVDAEMRPADTAEIAALNAAEIV